MEKYESKQQRILRPAQTIYDAVCDFRNYTPMLQKPRGGVERNGRQLCSFKAKGFDISLNIVDKQAPKYIKIKGDDSVPMDFTFWLQLQPVAEYDTRMRIVLHADLNMMMRMMIGKKLQEALDQIAAQIAEAFNR
ncbi:MAG: polyketide cyclase [Alistipes putredinis]|nr:MAG: polyketide cyclase [Alistipes putredinis]